MIWEVTLMLVAVCGLAAVVGIAFAFMWYGWRDKP